MRAYLYIIFTLIGMLLIPSLVHAIHHLPPGLQELPNSEYDRLPGPPVKGTGYYKYEPITPPSGCEPKDGKPSTMYWGSPAVTNAKLLDLTRMWEQVRLIDGFCPGYCALIGIGDMSFYYGGPGTCHGGHQHGLSVDFRLQRKDGEPFMVVPPNVKGIENFKGDYLGEFYSREKTRQLIAIILAYFSTDTKCLFFSDPKMVGTFHVNGQKFPKESSGHDNHIHLGIFQGPPC